MHPRQKLDNALDTIVSLYPRASKIQKRLLDTFYSIITKQFTLKKLRDFYPRIRETREAIKDAIDESRPEVTYQIIEAFEQIDAYFKQSLPRKEITNSTTLAEVRLNYAKSKFDEARQRIINPSKPLNTAPLTGPKYDSPKISPKTESAPVRSAQPIAALLNGPIYDSPRISSKMTNHRIINRSEPGPNDIPKIIYKTSPANTEVLEDLQRFITRIETNDVESKPRHGIFKWIHILFTKLQSFIQRHFSRIASNQDADKSDEIDFTAGFIVFKDDRGENRKANYHLARQLKSDVEQTDSLETFKDYETKRAKIIAEKKIQISYFFNHGIKSDELNSIIEKAANTIKP